jgi:hypothetical protein
MRKFVLLATVLAWGVAAVPTLPAAPAPTSARQTISLNGDWLFQREGAKADDWKTVTVPSSFEQHEGVAFNGVGWYRKSVSAFTLPVGKRVLLHFEAAATEAEVWWNGAKLGVHLGGWTSFRFDITELVRQAPTGQPHELRVRLDEKVGHNSQGFLPIIAPHFGGLWQGVEMLVVPDTYCDDLRLLAVGDLGKSAFQFELPLAGTVPQAQPPVSIRYRLRGETDWKPLSLAPVYSNGTFRASAPLAEPRKWSPATPNLYELQISLGDENGDRLAARAGFRTTEVFGQELRLNGQPLQIRGLLNWGYSPPLTAPNPEEAVWRKEIELARGYGFNLMKFCLWIPPRRYHELADELGMLTWAECPTWHPKLTQQYLEPLRREFSEFFYYDRNHPSVVLRSLTCETGPGAELPVIQNLYDLAKAMVPGSVVEDDSSWIGWNRVHDFYDDHPYGNNHTWVKALRGFNEHILAHGTKPLVLGESIAADTWMDHAAIVAQLGTNRPWHAPGPLDEVPRWLERMLATAGPGGLSQLQADSLRYGLLMRKYQTEAFRREIPAGGYVVSVIRDIPLCSMGLLDYIGKPKWTEADWAWQRDTICLLKTESDRRSFSAGERLRGEILLSHFGQQVIINGELEVILESLAGRGEILQCRVEKDIRQNLGTLARRMELDWGLPSAAAPMQLLVRAKLRTAQGEFRNEWPVWIVPAPRPDSLTQVLLHSSVPPETARELFPGARPLSGNVAEGVIVAARFDDELAQRLEKGGRVLLLPDGQRNSVPLDSHWFLRGAPYVPDSALTPKIPRELLVELQHFDLASQVVPDINYQEFIDPLLLLWDTHDLKRIKTHGLIFETRAGQGRLLVSAVNHRGENNAAGRWLLQVLVDHLNSPTVPRHALPAEVLSALKQQLHAEQTNLVASTWRFKPDPKNEGLSQGWQQAKLPSEDGWKDIRIGAAWESQGYPALDGWAWYRLSVAIPDRWRGRPVYLSFEGVDDMYELYVNGELAGKGGDLATRKDTFSEKKSYDLSPWVEAGESATFAVRVHDWAGAGGIFRPVTLGTPRTDPSVVLLK